MSVLDMLTATVPSVVRPDWCAKAQLGDDVIAMLWEPARGELDMRAVAACIDQEAVRRNMVVARIARVRKGVFEGVYAAAAEPVPVERQLPPPEAVT